MRSLGQALIKYDWRLCRKRKCGHRHARMKDDVRAQGEGSNLQTKGRGLRRNQTHWHLDLGSSLELWETKYLLFTPPSLRYFVMEVLAPNTGGVRKGPGALGELKLRGNKTWSVRFVDCASKLLLIHTRLQPISRICWKFTWYLNQPSSNGLERGSPMIFCFVLKWEKEPLREEGFSVSTRTELCFPSLGSLLTVREDSLLLLNLQVWRDYFRPRRWQECSCYFRFVLLCCSHRVIAINLPLSFLAWVGRSASISLNFSFLFLSFLFFLTDCIF